MISRVSLGKMAILVRADGEIQSSESDTIVQKMRSQASIVYVVGEGERVTNGQVLIRFLTDDLERALRESEAKLSDSEANVSNARSDMDIQTIDNQTSLKIAEQALRSAELDMNKFLEGDAILEKRNAELKVRMSESELARKEKRFAEVQSLLEEGFVTEDNVEEERIALDKAKVDAETARAELKIIEEYTLPLRKTNVENALAKAKTELEKTRKNTEMMMNKKEQAVRSASLSLDRARQDYTDKTNEIAKCAVRAPRDGVVTYGDPEERWTSREIRVGGRVHPGQVMITLPDLSSMKAVLDVPEADVQRLRTNQAVVVKVEALADQAFKGRITKIAEVANQDRWWSSLKYFKVDVALTNTVRLKPGFSCDAEVTVDVIASALSVPSQAVFKENDTYFVYLVKGRQPRKTEVTLGRTSDTTAEILDGLKEGDRVYLSLPEEDGGRGS
jgi:RND family efflux transporter MFP subunit